MLSSTSVVLDPPPINVPEERNFHPHPYAGSRAYSDRIILRCSMPVLTPLRAMDGTDLGGRIAIGANCRWMNMEDRPDQDLCCT